MNIATSLLDTITELEKQKKDEYGKERPTIPSRQTPLEPHSCEPPVSQYWCKQMAILKEKQQQEQIKRKITGVRNT